LRPIIFDVKVFGNPITDYTFRSGISTGVQYGVKIPGFVPIFEEHEVRIDAGYTLPEWEALEPGARAFEVAHSRIRRIKKMVEEDAVEIAMKRKNRRT
jgi:hypothetical protein